MTCRVDDRAVWQQYAVGLPTPIGMFVVDVRTGEILASDANGSIVHVACKLPWLPGFAYVIGTPGEGSRIGLMSPVGEREVEWVDTGIHSVAGHPWLPLLAVSDWTQVLIVDISRPEHPLVEAQYPSGLFSEDPGTLQSVTPVGWLGPSNTVLIHARYTRDQLLGIEDDELPTWYRWWTVGLEGEVSPFSPPGVTEQSFPQGVFELAYRNQSGLFLYAGGGLIERRLSAYRGHQCVWYRDAGWDFLEASPDGTQLLVGMGCEYLLVDLLTGRETVPDFPYYTEYPQWSA